MDNKKSIRFNCDAELLNEIDAYKSRYVCRTQLIESDLQHYLVMLKKNGVKQGNWSGWLGR
mgnify:CR=1 FL=1